jgi:hypothetical protein
VMRLRAYFFIPASKSPTKKFSGGKQWGAMVSLKYFNGLN